MLRGRRLVSGDAAEEDLRRAVEQVPKGDRHHRGQLPSAPGVERPEDRGLLGRVEAVVPIRPGCVGGQRAELERGVPGGPDAEPDQPSGVSHDRVAAGDPADVGQARGGAEKQWPHRAGRYLEHPGSADQRRQRVQVAPVPFPLGFRAHRWRQADGHGCALRAPAAPRSDGHFRRSSICGPGLLLRIVEHRQRPVLGPDRGPLASESISSWQRRRPPFAGLCRLQQLC
mmetsp:Transcript_18871/g.54589  ORF Transcript_18871/g.54589 Transcript_18871/m.54589 type:complete len:228 (+) Transcript_18871:718-1401(+)